MNKPDWGNAPKWANYLAMDRNGEWWWFELEPYTDDRQDFWNSIGRANKAAIPTWRETLEKRP